MSEKKTVKIDSAFKAVALGVSASIGKRKELRSTNPKNISTGAVPPANARNN
jgi:hypothetical protein